MPLQRRHRRTETVVATIGVGSLAAGTLGLMTDAPTETFPPLPVLGGVTG